MFTSVVSAMFQQLKPDEALHLPLEQQRHHVHDPHDKMRRLGQLPHCRDVSWFDGLRTQTHFISWEV